MKFKVTLIVPTVIRATITVEADSHVEAEIMGPDELKRFDKEHEAALAAYRNRGVTHMDYPVSAIDWDDSDAQENMDLASVEVDEVEQVEPSE